MSAHHDGPSMNYLHAFATPRLLVGLLVVVMLAGLLSWWQRHRYPGLWRLGLFAFVCSVGGVLLVTLLREPPPSPVVSVWPIGRSASCSPATSAPTWPSTSPCLCHQR